MILQERIYAYWLASIPGVANRTIDKLLEKFGTAEGIYHGNRELWKGLVTPARLEAMKQHREAWQLEEEYNRLQREGIQFILRSEEAYPRRLRNIPDAPYGIFVKGALPPEENICVAIIGARECSEYGRFIAKALGQYLGARGVTVISGMARGIDGISQAAALEAGGNTVAVLGSGVDVCYPAGNRALYDKIQTRGAVLSAFPPGTEPRAQNFPQRNRIVSGLADAVVVIEARQKSGTLITVDMALEQGKEVYVVPGRITDRLSDGCNRLLKQGAGVFLSPEEFLREVCEVCGRQAAANRFFLSEQSESLENYDIQAIARKVPPQLQTVYNALDFNPKSVEELLILLKESYNMQGLGTALMQLCLKGLVRQVSPGYFCLNGEREKVQG